MIKHLKSIPLFERVLTLVEFGISILMFVLLFLPAFKLSGLGDSYSGWLVAFGEKNLDGTAYQYFKPSVINIFVIILILFLIILSVYHLFFKKSNNYDLPILITTTVMYFFVGLFTILKKYLIFGGVGYVGTTTAIRANGSLCYASYLIFILSIFAFVISMVELFKGRKTK